MLFGDLVGLQFLSVRVHMGERRVFIYNTLHDLSNFSAATRLDVCCMYVTASG